MKYQKTQLKTVLASTLASASILAMSSVAFAQDSETNEVITTGIRQSLQNALIEKRSADSLVEVILAEDIGKLPDQNLAEVLENITGIQITRTAGVGTGVQIRGTDDNNVQINGVSTVGANGRAGLSFEDINASIIAGVEVTKSPEAGTTEGSVGGTINLRTIRPLDLEETLASFRVQGEVSNLANEGVSPRLSGTFGHKWENASGQEIGIVLSGSYTEQEAVSFRPRADRDNITTIPGNDPEDFLGVQFLVQEAENFDFETINFAGTIEAKPTPNTRLYFDAIVTDQQRSQDSYRLQASGIASFGALTTPTSFNTVDFGLEDLGSLGVFPAALTGIIEPDLDFDDDDPNLRFSSDVSARVTTNQVYTIGGEWEGERLSAGVEFSTSGSETDNPNLSTTLNFINPNVPLDGSSNDNSVPFIFDLSNDTLSFDVNFDSPFAPNPEDLINPANVVLDQVQVADDTTENNLDAFRVDLSYNTEDFFGGFITSVDAGYRFSDLSSEFNDVEDTIGGFSQLEDSPNGLLFQELLVEGPNNFDDADGRELFIDQFLLVDPDLAFSDPEGVLAVLEGALAQQRVLNPQADGDLTANLISDQDAFFRVEEETNAFYAQANFEYGFVRGNAGFRYIDTEVNSIGFAPADANGVRSLQTTSDSYDFFLPRINIVAEPVENVAIRFGYTEDVFRPDFSQLSSGFSFGQQENTAVTFGNPSLLPEDLRSIDVSVDWFFAPAAVLSVGYFNKRRTNLFGNDFEGAAIINGPTQEGFLTTGGLARETDPTCPGGGIFNPEVVPNVLGNPDQLGLCVDFQQPGNDPVANTQQGIEVAFQYDLSSWEDQLGGFGWASGLGLIANYTYQTFSGGSVIDTTSGRGLQVLGDVSIPRGLLDNSRNAYNITGFYEKFGLTIRARWTWREAFRTQDFGGGANTSGSSTFSFPVTTLDRGQLNASINYDVTDNFSVGVEGVNLTTSNITQRCVSETGPTCFVGFPDRRITFGGSYRF